MGYISIFPLLCVCAVCMFGVLYAWTCSVLYAWGVHAQSMLANSEARGVCEVTSSITLCLVPLRQGFSLNLELAVGLGWPVSFRDLPVSATQLWGYRRVWLCLFYMGAWDSDLGLHVFMLTQ